MRELATPDRAHTLLEAIALFSSVLASAAGALDPSDSASSSTFTGTPGSSIPSMDSKSLCASRADACLGKMNVFAPHCSTHSWYATS